MHRGWTRGVIVEVREREVDLEREYRVADPTEDPPRWGGWRKPWEIYPVTEKDKLVAELAKLAAELTRVRKEFTLLADYVHSERDRVDRETTHNGPPFDVIDTLSEIHNRLRTIAEPPPEPIPEVHKG